MSLLASALSRSSTVLTCSASASSVTSFAFWLAPATTASRLRTSVTPVDLSGEHLRLGLLDGRVDLAVQRHAAGEGVDVDVEPVDGLVREQRHLHLRGDPGVFGLRREGGRRQERERRHEAGLPKDPCERFHGDFLQARTV